jgi:CRISPR-associated endoribonuclease Cas6
MDFNLVQLAITVRTDDARQLCLSLPLLGNGFAAACRRNLCRWPERTCAACSRQGSCPWDLVFGQRLSPDPSALKRFQKPPLPFAFAFPVPPAPADGVTEIQCGLVVIGLAIPCLDMLLEGFAEILAPLSAEIVRVGTRDFQGIVHALREGCVINSPESLVVLSSHDLFESRIWTDTTLHIQMLTPLRLFDAGRLVREFDFSRFARSLLRRVSSLAYYYGAYEFNCEYKELSRQADAVVCTDDGFRLTTDRDRRTVGLMGRGSFLGDFSGLFPFLLAGVYLHTGKGSAFGMGAYELPEC